MTKKIQEDQFAMQEGIVKDPTLWRISANALFRAVRHLCYNHNEALYRSEKEESYQEDTILRWPILLLVGLGVENLLKSKLIEIDHANFVPVNNGKKFEFKWPGNGHDLKVLAEKIIERSNIEITDREKDILSWLTSYVLWGGRYPVALKPSDINQLENSEGSKLNKVLEEVDNLLKKINAACLVT